MRPLLALMLLAACKTPNDTDSALSDVDFTLTLTNTSATGDLVAEDGTQTDIALAPGVLVVHTAGWELFSEGSPASARPGLEALAETGDPSDIVAGLQSDPDVSEAIVFAYRTDSTYETAPMHPGESASLEVTVPRGSSISYAAMFGQSNDAFVATQPGGIPMYDGETPVTGDLTAQLALFDAGTEENQEPGVGSDQAPRQDTADAGTPENGVVTEIDGTDLAGWDWPSVSTYLSFTSAAE